MPSSSPQALRVYAKETVLRELPEFANAVAQARAENTEIELSLNTFPEDANLLYLCLWFAYEEGVSVQLLPKRRK